MAHIDPPKTRRHTGPLVILIAIAIGLAVLFRDSLSFEALSENREALLAYRDAHYGLSVPFLSPLTPVLWRFRFLERRLRR